MSQGVSPDEEKEMGQELEVRLLDQSQLPFTSNVGGPRFDDASDHLFSIYSKIATEEDAKMVERWQVNCDSIIIFAGLFSAAVAGLLSVSIPDLRPNPQETTNFYLQNINRLLADSNVPRPSSIPSDVAQPPPFSPPSYAIWTNLFWLLSLNLSLFCAVVAILVQKAARQYIIYTQPWRRSQRSRARVRLLYFRSIDRLFIECAVSILPCLLHVAGFLFALGNLSFFFNINRIIFYVMLFFGGIFALFYTFSGFVSFFHRDSLLDPPLAKLPVSALACAACFFLTIFSDRFDYKIWRALRWAFKDDGMYLEDVASKRASEIDIKVFEELLDSLDEDDAVDKFIRGIPGFFNCKSVDSLPTTLPAQMKDKFRQVLNQFLNHSNTVTEDVRNSRLIICLDACHAVLGPNDTSQILDNILDGKWPKLLQSIEMGHSLISWGNRSDEINRLYTRSIVSRIIANVETRNNRWRELVVNQLGISKDLLQEYVSHGDSVSLAGFINAARRIMVPNPRVPPSHSVPSALPDLQREFCASWNEIVEKARNSNDRISILILKNFRHIYIGLHKGTVASPTAFSASTTDDHILDELLSYPLCTIANHHSYPMPHPYGETAQNVSRSYATHSRIQAAHHSVTSAFGTHPIATIDNPSSLPAHLGSDPLPSPPSVVAAIGASEQDIAVSVISSTANPNPHHYTSRGPTGEYKEGYASPAVPSSCASAVVTSSAYLPHALRFQSAANTLTTTGPHNTIDLRTQTMQTMTKESRQPVKSASSTHDISADILAQLAPPEAEEEYHSNVEHPEPQDLPKSESA